MLTLLLVLAQDVEALKALGAEVSATRVAFKDCSKLGEAEYKMIGALKGLKSLTLYGGKKTLTDATLPLLAPLAETLEELNTEGTHITDAGLAGFAVFKNVKGMSFFHPSLDVKGFDGSGFVALKELPKLERLTIAGTRFDDKGMAAVAQITQLKDFRTWHTHQSQAGNAFLEKLPSLRSLTLGQRLRRWDGSSNATSLDDGTLDLLSRLQTLESLSLDEAKLSLEALLKLKALPKLKKLSLQRIDLSAEDVEKLKAALPDVKVDFKPMTEDERKKLEVYLNPPK
ncbi:MAG TPA: hypothetical protein VF950_28600 [Planctomycetota bacterium]